MAGGSLDLINSYIACGEFDKANHIMEALIKKSMEYLAWYLSLNTSRFVAAYRDCYQEVSILLNIVQMYDRMGNEDEKYSKMADNLDTELNNLYQTFLMKSREAGINMN